MASPLFDRVAGYDRVVNCLRQRVMGWAGMGHPGVVITIGFWTFYPFLSFSNCSCCKSLVGNNVRKIDFSLKIRTGKKKGIEVNIVWMMQLTHRLNYLHVKSMCDTKKSIHKACTVSI